MIAADRRRGLLELLQTRLLLGGEADERDQRGDVGVGVELSERLAGRRGEIYLGKRRERGAASAAEIAQRLGELILSLRERSQNPQRARDVLDHVRLGQKKARARGVECRHRRQHPVRVGAEIDGERSFLAVDGDVELRGLRAGRRAGIEHVAQDLLRFARARHAA